MDDAELEESACWREIEGRMSVTLTVGEGVVLGEKTGASKALSSGEEVEVEGSACPVG
jgi:hypothetical protein